MTTTSKMGATSAGCVELLAIRPLLVGAAWKVLDLLMETALNQAGFPPDKGGRWRIETKVRHARQRGGRPPAINPLVWSALTFTYAETEELRHSLVHRRAYIDASDALVGSDRKGRALSPMAASEHEAFGRAAQLAAEWLTTVNPDERSFADLGRQLGYLAAIHKVVLPTVVMAETPPEWTVVLDAQSGRPNHYELDLRGLRGRVSVTHCDLVVRFRDRVGQDLAGRLESAPAADTVIIDPDAPPPWLR